MICGLSFPVSAIVKMLMLVASAGADVAHPGPGVNSRPSIASLVWSHDEHAAQYAAFTRVQPPREEIIADLGEMMMVFLVSEPSFVMM